MYTEILSILSPLIFTSIYHVICDKYPKLTVNISQLYEDFYL